MVTLDEIELEIRNALKASNHLSREANLKTALRMLQTYRKENNV